MKESLKKIQGIGCDGPFALPCHLESLQKYWESCVRSQERQHAAVQLRWHHLIPKRATKFGLSWDCANSKALAFLAAHSTLPENLDFAYKQPLLAAKCDNRRLPMHSWVAERAKLAQLVHAVEEVEEVELLRSHSGSVAHAAFCDLFSWQEIF